MNANVAMVDAARPEDYETFVRSILKRASLNVLRLAMYQVTKDPELAAMRAERVPVRGGVFYTTVLAKEDRKRMIEKAVDYLCRHASLPQLPAPGLAEARTLMEMFNGRALSDAEANYGYEELAFEDFSRSVKWTTERPATAVLQDYRVTIIGAGISGLVTAIQLDRLGIPYVIIERQGGVGGTWWINDYPEARVDISSFLYQFKFEKDYPWKEFFSSRDETLKYLQFVAEKYGITKNIRFDTELVSARWDEDTAEWIAVTRHAGVEQVVRSRILISAAGLFATPQLPDIEGIDQFKGAIFHTTAWDHEFDYRNKKIALIGNGSTGTQLMPKMAEASESLVAFQRTPQWIMPMENYGEPVPSEMQWLIDNVPYYWNWFCYSTFLSATGLQDGQSYDREWQKNGGLISQENDRVRALLTEYIREKVGDEPDLLAKCLPDYAPFARRLVVDNGWFDALRRPNVELVTDRIDRFTPKGIRTVDGVEREFDLVILGSGFAVSRFLWPVEYQGRERRRLEDLWAKDGARSYLGVTLPSFPNFFMLYGPNGQARSGGFHSWAEIWSRYIAKLIVQLIEAESRSIEVRYDVFEKYNEKMDQANKELIWEEEGKGSYYVNAMGRSATNIPWPVEDYHDWLNHPNYDDYIIEK